jgi:adenosylcobinamide-GDP ribazoletransferase
MVSFFQSFLGAIVFYTIIPLPQSWQLELKRIARWAPLIGLLLGVILCLSDFLLAYIRLPILTRTVVILGIWVVITGGLHLDGAMDTADGLGVTDVDKRLEVMQDSRTGAFGAIAAIFILLLKFSTLIELDNWRYLGLISAPVWGRWGQLWAIAFYPYLKPTGKGAFHKEQIQLPQDFGIGIVCLIALTGLEIFLQPEKWWLGIVMILSGLLISSLINFWFYRRLGGFTGDVYGAVVEWIEAIFLGLLTIFLSNE